MVRTLCWAQLTSDLALQVHSSRAINFAIPQDRQVAWLPEAAVHKSYVVFNKSLGNLAPENLDNMV